MRDLLVVGAGGFARETVEAVRAINAEYPTWNLLGLLDDNPDRCGKLVGGVPVVGPIEHVHREPWAQVVLTTGRPDHYVSRPLIAARLGLPDKRYATIVHPRPPSAPRARSASARCCSRTSTSPPTSASAATSS